jgi:hypothetical protein
MKTYTYKAVGTIQGKIWMPSCICEKEFSIKFSREDVPFRVKFETLEDIKNHITNDGDFQSCEIIGGILIVTMHYSNRTIERVINLA